MMPKVASRTAVRLIGVFYPVWVSGKLSTDLLEKKTKKTDGNFFGKIPDKKLLFFQLEKN